MSFPVYTLVYGVAVAAAAPYYLWRGRRQGKYHWNLADRLGLRLPDPPMKTTRRIWIHALSLGEVISAVELVGALVRRGYEVYLSTTTRSGFEISRKLLPETPHLSSPLDWPPAIGRVISAVDPDLFIVVETDMWPNLLSGLAVRGVPAVMVNGRVSPRSFSGYRLLGRHIGRVLDLVAYLGCQTMADRDRLLKLGARPERLFVTGNLKYDRPAPLTGDSVKAELLEESGLPGGLWLVAGSTHPGEEEIVLDIHARLRSRHQNLRLLVAPRNKERFEEVWRLIRSTGLSAARRSQGRVAGPLDVFLLDTLGELDRFYELGDVVFVGKSLPMPGEGGGHNLLEPAARSKPVVYGPRMHNFPEIAGMMAEAGGGQQVADAVELEAALDRLLSEPQLRFEMGDRARKSLELHQGALGRSLDLVERALAGGVSDYS